MKGTKVLLLLVSLLNFISAQSQEKIDTVRIEEVKVLAKRKIEEAGLKITRPDSIQRAGSLTTDLSEIISLYSPVFIKSSGRGSVATASFRGTAASHTQVLWNGMNLNSPMRGLADLSLLPVFFTDEIYLLHGGSSMTKGSGALGGSIVLENLPDWNSRFSLEGLAENGSFHSQKAFFKLKAGIKSFQTSTRLFYETSRNDFPFYNSGVIPKKMDTLQNADFNKTGILQEFYLRHGNENISSLRFWFQKNKRNLPQLMSYQGSVREEFQNDKHLRVQFDWKKYTEEFNYHFFSGINSARLDYYRATPEFEFVNEDSESNETSFLNHFRIFKAFENNVWATVSLDMNYHQVRTFDKNKASGFHADRLESSLLVNFHLKPTDRFAAFVLIRSENYDKRVVPFIPSAGMEWQIFEYLPLVLRSNIARNFHKPTLNDLYWKPGGNPDLLAEEGFTGDISLAGEWTLGKLKFKNELTGFLSKIENWIIWQPAANGAYFWEAGNVKDVLSKGLEYQYSASFEWKKFMFRSGGNYSLTNTSNLNAVNSVDESRGKQLIYIPKHKGGFYLSTTWKSYSLKYDLNGVGKRYTKSSNLESDYERVLNPYWLSKIAVDKQIPVQNFFINLKFSVENLFNQNYQSILWRPSPGRFYTISAALKYHKK